jgi:hypothetical protein
MKKTTFFAVCILLLFGGLLCLHLVAQSDKAKENAAVSLLEPKIKELGERELLEMKVARYRKLADIADLQWQTESRNGTVAQQADAYAQLAAAEIELYRFTGDRDKLIAALDAKVEALTRKVEYVTVVHEVAKATPAGIVYEAEIQLLDALLELKREISRK